MSQLTQYQENQTPPFVVDSIGSQSTDTTELIINPQALAQMSQFAQIMAQSQSMVPQHMQGNVGDCMAVTMQAMQWGMNPFAVAQKTFNIKGVLGYEAQLINAVITSNAPITGRLQFEWFGPWENILGDYKNVEAKSGKPTKVVGGWKKEDEAGLGVKVWATMVGEDEPRVLELLLVQASVRNSPLWSHDPKQQLAYLAIKRWARLYCPDVILGVYTPDELAERGTGTPKDVTPETRNAGAGALLNRVKAKKVEAEPIYFNATELLATIESITDPKQIAAIEQQVQILLNDQAIKVREEDAEELTKALSTKKFDYLLERISECKTLDDVEKMQDSINKRAGCFSESSVKYLQDTLNGISEEIGAAG